MLLELVSFVEPVRVVEQGLLLEQEAAVRPALAAGPVGAEPAEVGPAEAELVVVGPAEVGPAEVEPVVLPEEQSLVGAELAVGPELPGAAAAEARELAQGQRLLLALSTS